MRYTMQCDFSKHKRPMSQSADYIASFHPRRRPCIAQDGDYRDVIALWFPAPHCSLTHSLRSWLGIGVEKSQADMVKVYSVPTRGLG